ncbi:GntR family transcriptional regulator [Mangrovicoccus sp. HB161399]|uniref:GntR family transcriptional regulator n=1 Tax=Mangrovicoccus sp. HB161399 TaxID=2720392 RepID=UPI001554A30C|nr:GntR family transcriptional regulator [Mangrovicoccus sp. HB161399]
MEKPDSPSHFAPLGRDGLVDRVANLLGEAIIRGKLKPGSRLSESVIARDLGVSRAPVREAARLLESSGLVAYQPNRGFFVRKISAKELDDLYELRIVIETAAALRVVREAPEAAIDGLAAQIERLREVSTPEVDMLTQMEADMEFHRLMIAASGNPRFSAIFDQLAKETELCVMVIGRLYGDPRWIADTHVPILDSLRARDEAATRGAIEYHIGEARRLVTQQFRLLEE